MRSLIVWCFLYFLRRPNPIFGNNKIIHIIYNFVIPDYENSTRPYWWMETINHCVLKFSNGCINSNSNFLGRLVKRLTHTYDIPANFRSNFRFMGSKEPPTNVRRTLRTLLLLKWSYLVIMIEFVSRIFHKCHWWLDQNRISSFFNNLFRMCCLCDCNSGSSQ